MRINIALARRMGLLKYRDITCRRSIGLLLLMTALAAGADLGSQIDRILRAYPHADLSIHILRASDGQTIYAHQATRPMIPASNMKLVTCAAALRYLGPDFVYTTRVYLCDQDLVIVGSGDPLLGDRQTDRRYGRPPEWIPADIANRLAAMGVASIRDIVLDTTIFDDQRVHPAWPADQLNRWYASEVCGINYNCNCIALTVTSQQGSVRVMMDPPNSYIRLINRVEAVRRGPTGVAAYRQPDAPNTIILKGTCRDQEGPFDIAIERPAMLFGWLIANAMAKAGIRINGQLLEKAAMPRGQMTLVCQYQTQLKDCLMRANKDSLGLAAEALLKTMAARSRPDRPGSWAGGQAVLTNYLASLGIEPEQFRIDDGSGLSRNNRLSACCLTRVLYDMYKDQAWDLFKGSLAIAGVDGTLQRYFPDARFSGRVLGKTGYLSQVRALSGLCTSDGGDIIFSILANEDKADARQVINEVVKAILEQKD